MKKIILSSIVFIFSLSINAQTINSVFSNWLDSGNTANAYKVAGIGNQHVGFGVVNGTNIVSPLIWMYNSPSNSFSVRSMGYNQSISSTNSLFTVRSSGKVGIGIENPDSKLTVNGKIHCKEVLVDLDFPAPDYVFQKYYTGFSTLNNTYTMPTLEEVEEFTKKNHHLPEVPSAEEIQKEGLELKEMTKLLLQKIEELTLYTIEQEKRIKALEGKLKKKK